MGLLLQSAWGPLALGGPQTEQTFRRDRDRRRSTQLPLQSYAPDMAPLTPPAAPSLTPLAAAPDKQALAPAQGGGFLNRLAGLPENSLFQMGMSFLGNAQNGGNWAGALQSMQEASRAQLERQRMQNEMRRGKIGDQREGEAWNRQQTQWTREDELRQRLNRWAEGRDNFDQIDPSAAYAAEAEARALSSQPMTPYQREQLRIAGLSAGRQNVDDIRQDQRMEAQLRNQFQSRHQDFAARRDAYSTLRTLQNGGQDSDIAFIYTYMKMLDPTSVVREGEFATAENAGGVPERLRNQYNRIMRGGRLSDTVRADMVTTARRLYDTAAEQFERDRQMQVEMASGMGLRPEILAPDLRLPPETLLSEQELEAIANSGATPQAQQPRRGGNSPWDNSRRFWGMSTRD